MSESRPPVDLAVSPAQVWAALTAESQSRAILLMAHLASNLVNSLDGASLQEVETCSHRSPLRRSGANTLTAPH